MQWTQNFIAISVRRNHIVSDSLLTVPSEKADGLNLFFCFRWILIAFKRELPFEDVLRLWEVLWTDYYTNEFVLFVALAVLESHRDVILRYLVEVRPNFFTPSFPLAHIASTSLTRF